MCFQPWPTSILSFKTCGDLCDPERHLTPPLNSRLVRLYLSSVPLCSGNLACQRLGQLHRLPRVAKFDMNVGQYGVHVALKLLRVYGYVMC